ncbi:protein peste-like [Zophobas morio]|uniref:protein peste-like n=1 Tax=Zophobas morio TaxID=2755281 RepID=UPI0030837D7C
MMVTSAFSCTASAVLGGCGLLLICLWSVIFDNFLTLRNNSLIYRYWKNEPLDIHADFYFFNWTNPEDFYDLSVKPKFEEVGPYSFLQKIEKTNITWNDNDTVTFQQKKFWIFQKQKGGVHLKDPIVTLNPIPLITSYLLRDWNYYTRRVISMTLSTFFGEHHMTQTVESLLFKGYYEPLMKIAAATPMLSQYDLPNWEGFGYFYDVTTEKGKNADFGYIHFWNYQNKSRYFDDACGDVRGSAEYYFPKNLKKNILKYFMPDMAGSTNLTFEKEESVSSILGYKYVIGEKTLDNGTNYPENRCLCSGECVPSGTINMTRLRHSLPVFVSLPHFYKADPYYINLVDGLEPNKSKHDFYVIVEPTTGIPLKGNMALQANLLVQPVSGLTGKKKRRTTTEAQIALLASPQGQGVIGLHSPKPPGLGPGYHETVSVKNPRSPPEAIQNPRTCAGDAINPVSLRRSRAPHVHYELCVIYLQFYLDVQSL